MALMIMRGPRKGTKDPFRDAVNRDRDFLLALSRAVQSIQRARTDEEFYEAVGIEFQSLGIEATLMMVNEDHQSLSIVYTSYAPSLIRKAEKLTGLSIKQPIHFSPHTTYGRVLETETATYIESTSEVLRELFPSSLQYFVEALVSMFNLGRGILAPLKAEKNILGVLKVNGAYLVEQDLPAIESFAGQIAAGLQNLRLVRQLQDELDARKRAEESLGHSRGLLLALGHAAQAVQLAHEPDEIFQVIGEQIRALECQATILLFGDDQRSLYYRYTTAPENLIRVAEKLSGGTAEEYGWTISPDSVYGRIVMEGKAEYIEDSEDMFKEALPVFLQSLSRKVMEVLNANHGILAPLRVGDEPYGVLIFYGNDRISRDDLPAVDSFAGQVSVSLRNAILAQRVETELKERKRVEENLRISQTTFEGIFNSVTETIYVQDENGVFLDVNLGAENMYGYPRGYFVGRTPEFLSAPGRNDLSRVKEYVQKAFNGTPTEFEFWGLKKDGTVFPKEVRLNAGMYFGRKAVIAVARDVTERRKTEEALRSSEARVHALLDAVPDILFVMTREGNYVDYYTSHLDELLVAPSEFLGKNIRDIMPGEIVDLYFTTLNQLLRSGESKLFEYSLALPDGVHEFEAHIDWYQGEYILCVTRDVTERKRAEVAVRQAERRFRAMIENAPDGIAMVGMDGQIKYASPAAINMFGYTNENYAQENPLDLIHPDDMGIVIGALAGLIDDSTLVTTVQYRFKHKDGLYHWVESIFSNQFSEPGVEAIVINFRDITERKQMEKAIHESEEYYRALIENATDGIMVINTEAKISYESPSIARLLGYGKAGLMWRNAFELIHPDDLSQIIEAFMSGLASPGFVHRGEYRLLHFNGEWRYFEIVSHYLMNDPAIRGIIINGRDITQRRLAEEAVHESERRFHSFVSESTDGMLLTDEDGRIIEFNDALERITGLKREAVLGTFAWDFQFQTVLAELRTPEMFQRIKDGIQHWLETGQDPSTKSSVEIPIVRANDALRFVQIRKFSMRTEKGWRLGSLSHDITEKKQAEQALQQQFTRLQNLYQLTATLGRSAQLEEVFDTALASLQETLTADRSAILLFDSEGVMRFRSWRNLSEEYRKIAEGHSPWKQNESHPQPILVPDVYADASLFHLRSSFESEGVGALGFIPLVHQGRLLGKFMIYFNAPRQFGEGEIQLAQTIAGHVAFAIFRQQAETALRASEEMYRILFDDNPSMYFTADENGLTLSVNKFGVSQMGFAPEEMIGQPIVDIFHPDDREEVRQQLKACLQQPEQNFQIEARKLDKNRKVMWVRESACAVRDVHGRLVILITCDDITSRKQAEDELRQVNSSLEFAHRELQSVLAQEQALARTDSLTGLNNRRYFFELAVREFNLAVRYRHPLTVILFDVDGFKQANDSFGHAYGDEILSQLSKMALSQKREVDILARFGGDEFIILLPQTNAEQAFTIAERIRQRISQKQVLAGGVSIGITISLGVAEISYAPKDQSVEDIISRADKALYKSKQNGRNHTMIFGAD